MTALYVVDKNGEKRNVIYGYSDPERYQKNPFFLGATCGRYAGRIAKHSFHIGEREYKLESEGDVHLHGGPKTFAFRPWEMTGISTGEEPGITYRIKSEHMDGGYPGTIEVEANYTLRQNCLIVEFRAKTDRSTHLNLTNHNYYNLAGGGRIGNHLLMLNAQSILETDANNVPTGGMLPVAGTPFDHTSEKKLDHTLKTTSLDHVYVLGDDTPQALLFAPESGITMKLSTNQPGVVVFTPEDLGKGPWLNTAPEKFPAVCLETQNFPNAPNLRNFPSSLLKKDEVYLNETILEFGIR